MVLVGVAVERARVLPRGTGMLLAVATVLFAALEGPFLPIAGDIAVLAFSAAHVWLGRALLVAGLPHRVSGEGSDRTTAREGTAR